MAQLVLCENCGDRIGALETPHLYDSHVVCEICHGKLSKKARPPESDIASEIAKEVGADVSPSRACPRCAVTDTSSVHVLYMAHTRTSTGSGLTVFGNGELAVTGFGSQSRSLLADSIAPPGKKVNTIASIGMWTGFIGGGLLLLMALNFVNSYRRDERSAGMAMLIVSALLIGFGVVCRPVWLREQKFNKIEHPRLLQAWRQNWICMRCGYRWKPVAG